MCTPPTAQPSIIGLGHSIGGQFFGICKAQDKLSALVLIASQHGHFRNWDLPHRRRISFQWLMLIPTFTRVFGYFPGKRLGVMEDLPPGMVHEWVKWGRSPGYLFDHVPASVTPTCTCRYYSGASPMTWTWPQNALLKPWRSTT